MEKRDKFESEYIRHIKDEMFGLAKQVGKLEGEKYILKVENSSYKKSVSRLKKEIILMVKIGGKEFAKKYFPPKVVKKL